MSRSCSVKHHARVTYDAHVLKTFWEKRIELHMEQLQKEDMRIRRSALERLRNEWARQLERRNQMLQSSREAPRGPAPPGTPALRAGDQPAA
ncbi:protein FAM240C [Ovis canadensis]|uniref:protein FAM240C n=1 Tax=Ovis canadensis TaxID=37174 RepID=UPI003751A726